MELKHGSGRGKGKRTEVLIVPFMELKHNNECLPWSDFGCLNRTFYGIETR